MVLSRVMVIVLLCMFFAGYTHPQIPGLTPEVLEQLRAQHGDAIVDMINAVNVDESKVPDYELPVINPAKWTSQRVELLTLFAAQIYGPVPDPDVNMTVNVVEQVEALEGLAMRKQLKVTLARGEDSKSFNVLLYLPRSVTSAPVFLGLNFDGNHTTHADPDIEITSAWVRNRPGTGVTDNVASALGRGSQDYRWPYKEVVERGYGVATVYYGELAPDDPKVWREGLHTLIESDQELSAIGVWAWGLSRILDALVKDPRVDPDRIAVLGHSRLGKAALWAGANDTRFGLVISNNSGAMGAALSRRRFGETVGIISTIFPHWFVPSFKRYAQREDQLPIDQHQLLALIAPRPVYVASAQQDLWADPRGEFLSLQEASKAYRAYGKADLSGSGMPTVGRGIQSSAGYHLRQGSHDITLEDWNRFMRFAESRWNGADSSE